MIINDENIIDALIDSGNINYEVIADGFDLNNPAILQELDKVTSLKLKICDGQDFFAINESSGYEQLKKILFNCKNIESLNLMIVKNPELYYGNEFVKELLRLNTIKDIRTNMKFDYDSLYKLIIESNKDVKIHLSRIYDKNKELDYFKKYIHLKEILKISNFSSNELNQLSHALILNQIPIDIYIKYTDIFLNNETYVLLISNVNELDLNQAEKIKSDSRITGIKIMCGYRCDTIYTISEYIEIRKTIDNIIGKINMPSEDDLNREKIIFAQIYKILGQNINYDYYAISDEAQNNEVLENDCRNLKNGLLGVNRDGQKQYICVCAGYATILQNICSVVGIKCNYINSNSKEILPEGVFHLTNDYEHVYENGTDDPMGHAYNSVVLDGQAYFCDLTWDAERMKIGNGTLSNFLCSYEDFYKSHKSVGFTNAISFDMSIINQQGELHEKIDPNDYNFSLPISEQMKLFSVVAKKQIDEMVSCDYLAGFVYEYLEFVKQCANENQIKQYLDTIKLISEVENYIMSEQFAERVKIKNNALAVTVEQEDQEGDIVEKNIKFYDSTEESISHIRENVENMGGGTWKIR